MLPAVRVVEMVARKEREPVGEHGDEPAVGKAALNLVLGQLREAESGQGGVQSEGDVVEHQLPFDFNSRPPFSNSHA